MRELKLASCAAAASGALFGGCHAFAKDEPHLVLLALSKADHVLALVDPHSLKVTARIAVGVDPHEVIASPDGTRAYVSIYGSGLLHEIDVIDLVKRKPLPALDTMPLYGPHGLAFANGKLWFTAEGSRAIGEYDPARARFDWSMGTSQIRTHMIYVLPDVSQIYTTNVTSGTVSVFEHKPISSPGYSMRASSSSPGGVPIAGWTETVVPVTPGSEGFDVTPNGKELWTASANDGSIAVIDLVNKKLSRRIDAGIKGANRLKFTPDGSKAIVSSLYNGDLLIYDVASRSEIKRLSLGHGAAGILVDADGKRAFVGCSLDNYIAVVDLAKLKVVARINVGAVPDGLAWADVR